jgi:microsomal dipeptidase-like Zn-dependent dipeptidase
VRPGARPLVCVALALVAAAIPAGAAHARTSSNQAAIVQQNGSGGTTASGPSTPSAATRYSLANGCFGLRAAARDRFAVKEGSGYRASAATPAGGERFYLKATRLGSYLLYDRDRELLAVDALGRVAPARRASPAADWDVRGSRASGFTLANRKVKRSLAVNRRGRLMLAGDAGVFSFRLTTGCRPYPEIEVNASGPRRKGTSPDGTVSGLVDAHMHHMAFEFLGGRAHCGRPWHPYGAPFALQDCPDHKPNHAGAVLENQVSQDRPVGIRSTDGWPTFKGWPHHASLTHEQSYYKWLERSWRGGQRIFVNLLVENEVLCELYPLKKNSCNEMDSARLQARRMRELENYIDAQNGGPGKGWYRIVRSPAHARRVINQGKLAVVMGMETSKPFNCGMVDPGPPLGPQPTCNAAQVNRQIDEFHKLGVRQLELVNKFDNAFTGVAGDEGDTGTVTNFGNFYDTNRFWELGTCENRHFHDRYQQDETEPAAGHDHNDHNDHNEDALIANGLRTYLPKEEAPVYLEPRPLCNEIYTPKPTPEQPKPRTEAGLSELGEHALGRIMAKGMIFDPDHMSVYARQEALSVLERKHYSGVVSSHSWSTKDAIPRIYKLGGVVTPYAGNSKEFVAKWRSTRKQRGSFYFGFGYGADMNGFGSQGEPRGGTNPVTYPFRSYDGRVTFRRQRSGTRTYDINRDGVAHYGLYPDWVEDTRKVAGTDGPALMREMGRGAEAYLRMWERAERSAGR